MNQASSEAGLILKGRFETKRIKPGNYPKTIQIGYFKPAAGLSYSFQTRLMMRPVDESPGSPGRARRKARKTR